MEGGICGIASANPFAIRALEKAANTSCSPLSSRVLFPKLAHFRAMPAYLKDARLSENPSQCVVDTGFTVQNDEVHHLSDRQAASIAYLRKRGKWTNGSTGLDPGQEFLAIMMY